MSREILELAPAGVFNVDRFGRQPWRKQTPAKAARQLLEALEPDLACKLSRRALAAARRARSRRHFAYWSEVGDALARNSAPCLDSAAVAL